MYPCIFGLSNQDVRLSLTQASRPVTKWRELISPEINCSVRIATAGRPHAPVAITQQWPSTGFALITIIERWRPIAEQGLVFEIRAAALVEFGGGRGAQLRVFE